MVYTDNTQLIIELKKILLDKHISQKELASKLNLSPQGFIKLINKKNFSFDDMQRILKVIDYDLDINFTKK